MLPCFDRYGIVIYNSSAIDCLRLLPDQSINCCVTSPPYWGLRDYEVGGQLGLEATPQAYIDSLVETFREVFRVLHDDGTVWLNLGDSYAASGNNSGSTPESLTEKQRSNTGVRYKRRTAPSGLKPKDLVGIPWRVALALQADGWYLRSDIIWHKPNPMPESVLDRCTRSHEYIFLLSKQEKYYYDAKSISEPLARPNEGERKTPARFGGAIKFHLSSKQSSLHSGNEYLGTKDGKRNRRTVWTIAAKPFHGAHFATFPDTLAAPCILAGCPAGGTVLDPFAGSGTVAVAANHLNRNSILIEIKQEYCDIAINRISKECLQESFSFPDPVETVEDTKKRHALDGAEQMDLLIEQ